MKTKVLFLHSGLRTTQRFVDRFQRCFPELELEPVSFVANETQNLHYQDFSDVAAVYCTFMTGEKVAFIKKVPIDIPVIWGIPGGDLYNRYLRYFGYQLCFSEKQDLVFKLGSIYRGWSRKKEFNYLMHRCSAIAGAHCDYKIIQQYKKASSPMPKWIPSLGYPVKKMLGKLFEESLRENIQTRIVIGNSASRTNNHLYVLQCLKKINIGNTKVSLMMSYGDADENYKSTVRNEYSVLYGQNVDFVTDYMQLDEYNQLLLSFSHFIYGNWRQEAIGNIMTALYLGGKVYLSKRNPLLNEFREKGYHIFELEDIEKTFNEEFSYEDKLHNRSLVENSSVQNKDESFRQNLTPYFLKDCDE